MGYCFDTRCLQPGRTCVTEEEAVEGLKLLFTISLRFVVITTNNDKKEAGNLRSIMQHNEAFVRWKMEGYFNKTSVHQQGLFEISLRRRGD